MDIEILSKIGLSKGEIKIYSILLELGVSNITKIHEKTGIERRNIYDILNKLIERGLVTYIQENKKRLFKTTNPDKIISYIEDKENSLQKIKKDVQKQIPDLTKKFNSRQSTINGEIFRGKEGIKTIWDDSLNYKEIYWIGSGRYVPKKYPAFFAMWNKKRVAKGIKLHNILREEMRGKIKPWVSENIKFLPKEFSANPVVIGIHGNKVVNYSYGKELFAFAIENQDIAESYKAYFKYLWNKVAKK
ncbi:MAG: helix-turn-helix domain-containing protein [Candidatus ainarchaeum sp.]|nr:helix-turn-helix domain-containing protein [Candidatus ainarchaeum sp.]